MGDRREVDETHRQLIDTGRHVVEGVVPFAISHSNDRLASAFDFPVTPGNAPPVSSVM